MTASGEYPVRQDFDDHIDYTLWLDLLAIHQFQKELAPAIHQVCKFVRISR